MGRHKQIREQEDAQGFLFVPDERTACATCPDGGEEVARFVAEAEWDEDCWYCRGDGASRRPAAPVNDILEFTFDALGGEYGQVDAEGMPVTRDGYLLDVYEGMELIRDVAGLDITHEGLMADIERATQPYLWCEREPLAPRPHERSLWSWRRFAELVEHRVRYVVYEYREEPQFGEDWDAPIAPHEMLEHLGEWVGTLPSVLHTLPAGTPVWRARVGTDPAGFRDARSLGPPPPERAVRPNRMSAPGIPMFYGALERTTAITETSLHTADAGWVTAGRFELERDITILDLADIPDLPSIFAPDSTTERAAIRFLIAFSREISRPVVVPDAGHYDYAPTQYLTEYFRHIFRTPSGRRVDGVAYPTARDRSGTNIAIFIGPDGCRDQADERAGSTLVLTDTATERLAGGGRAHPSLPAATA